MSEQLDWLDMLEAARPQYLYVACAVALRLLEKQERITINDVREVIPPPADIDPRVMGAVFRCPLFEATGDYVRSDRNKCHNRPIQYFRRAA